MAKVELVIELDEAVYEGLLGVVGAGEVNQFIETLLRPYVHPDGLEAAYAAKAADEGREAAAWVWSEGLVGETIREPW